jgi:hypothetical protein
MYSNLKTLIASPLRILTYMILVLLAASLWWYSTDIRIMFGNYGDLHTYTDIVLSLVMILVFPLFLVALFYKSYKYGKRADIGIKMSTSVIGAIFTTILAYVIILILVLGLLWTIAYIIIIGTLSPGI